MRRTKEEVKAEFYSRLDEYKRKKAARRKYTVICSTFVIVVAVTIVSAHMIMRSSETNDSFHQQPTGNLTIDLNKGSSVDGAPQTKAPDKYSPSEDIMLYGAIFGDYDLRGNESEIVGTVLGDVRIALTIESETQVENNVFCSDVIKFIDALEKFELTSGNPPAFESPITFTLRDMDGNENVLQYENGDVIYFGNLYTASDGGAEINALLAKYGFE